MGTKRDQRRRGSRGIIKVVGGFKQGLPDVRREVLKEGVGWDEPPIIDIGLWQEQKQLHVLVQHVAGREIIITLRDMVPRFVGDLEQERLDFADCDGLRDVGTHIVGPKQIAVDCEYAGSRGRTESLVGGDDTKTSAREMEEARVGAKARGESELVFQKIESTGISHARGRAATTGWWGHGEAHAQGNYVFGFIGSRAFVVAVVVKLNAARVNCGSYHGGLR